MSLSSIFISAHGIWAAEEDLMYSTTNCDRLGDLRLGINLKSPVGIDSLVSC